VKYLQQFLHGENCGRSSETFLFAKTSTRRQQVYQILHCMYHCQAIHQEARLYTPIPTLDNPYESMSMDYMSDLSSTKQGNDCVFVVVDPFLKMAILTTCKKNITVADTSKLLFK
jgi:hypothetical protein